MGRFRRITSLLVLVSFVLGHVVGLDWQGMAARSNSASFPAGGYFAASSAFPVNSLIDVTNPVTGKRVRVLVVTTLQDQRLLIALSPEAAAALDVPANVSISVRAARVPLPSGLGTDYGQELQYASDPDLFPASASASRDALASAGADKPAATALTPSPAALPAVEPIKEPVQESVKSEPVQVPVQTAPSMTEPAPVVPSTVPPPEPSATPDSGLPALVQTPGSEPVATLPQPEGRESTPPVQTPAAPRSWVGIRSGMDSLDGTRLSTGQVGQMSTAPAPVASPTLAPAPAAVATSGGLAQGLGAFQKTRLPLNPGDVSRPEQSFWLTSAGSAGKQAKLSEPALAKKPVVTGPEADASTRPSASSRPSWALADPRTPAVATVQPTPAEVDRGLPYLVGTGMYGRQLADARSRSVVRPLATLLDESDQAEALSWTAAPLGASISTVLPEAQPAAADAPDGFNPWLASPGTGTAIAGDLPEALVSKDDKPDPGLKGQSRTIISLESDLPLARLADQDTVDGGMSLRTEAPVLDPTLAEARVGKDDKPDVASPGAYADSVFLGFDDSMQEPMLPGLASIDGGLSARPGSAVAIGDLAIPGLPGQILAEGGIFVRPDGFWISPDLATPGLPGAVAAESGLYLQPDGTWTPADLARPGFPRAASVEGSLVVWPDGTWTSADLTNPALPGTTGLDSGLSAIPDRSDSAVSLTEPTLPGTIAADVGIVVRPDGTWIPADLASPGLPASSAADAGYVIRPDGTIEAVSGLSDPKLPGTSTIDPTLAGTEPAAPTSSAVLPGPSQVESGTVLVPPPGREAATTLVPAKDPAAPGTSPAPSTSATVTEILSYLDPGTSTAPVTRPQATITGTGELPPALMASLKEYDWARTNLPIVARLQKSTWYVQVGSFANPRTAAATIKTLAPGRPIVVLPETKGATGLYKVYVGPLNEDEKGLMLYWFRSKGYRDAYLREGTPE